MTTTVAVQLAKRGNREIAATRSFDAPRGAVFSALTKSDLVKQWLLGPPGWTMPVCEMDLRIGGAYRFEWRNAEGAQMGLSGKFLEIQPPSLLVNTGVFDQPWYPGEAVVTNAFSEQDGRTTLGLTIRHATTEARDGVLNSPMQHGLAASYDRLAKLLASTT